MYNVDQNLFSAIPNPMRWFTSASRVSVSSSGDNQLTTHDAAQEAFKAQSSD
jgi:hypothetical protein